MKRKNWVLFISLVILLKGYAFAVAPQEKATYIAPNETIKDNYYWTGGILDFNGHALKDLVLFGDEVNVRGIVEGDVIAFAQRIRIYGEVKGNVRALGNTISLLGKVGKNATVAGKSLEVPKGAEIGWDLIAGGQRLYVEGKVNGDIRGALGEAILGGEVGGNVDLKVRELSVLPPTHIKGNLIYSAERETVIPKEAKVEGKVIYTPLPFPAPKPAPKGIPFVFKLLWLLGFIATGVVLLLLFPRQMKETSEDMLSHPWLTIGWGFFVLIVTPIGATLIFFSIIGIPLTFITWALYLIALYLTTPLVGTALGMKILQRFSNREAVNIYASFGIGVVLFFLLKQIPFFGWIISLLGICWGLGGMQEAIGKRIKAGRLGPQV